VTSSFGAMFAPDHQAVADELVRVCRPGGTIGDSEPGPLLWGSEEHVRELLGDRMDSLELTRRHYVERSPGDAAAYCELFKETFGPVVGLYASLADQPERLAALDGGFVDFAVRADKSPPGGPAEYAYEYLLVVGRTRRSSFDA
jgi:hypothetical protein